MGGNYVRPIPRRGLASSPEGAAPGAIWIDVPTVDRQTLEEVVRRASLPLELVTYCLLSQHKPKVVPCAAWLYCTWQVPACRPAPGLGDAEVSFHMEEVKACLGPAVVVTAHEPRRWYGTSVAILLSDGAELVRKRPANLLVTLAERVSDMYVSAHELVAMGDEGIPSRHRDRAGRARAGSGLRLLRRHLRSHREAIEKLRSYGRRWLDSDEIDRLSILGSRLAGVAVDQPPNPRDQVRT
jgi:hypothetical protein